MSCGVTNTLYGNQVAPTIMREYGKGLQGGCLCGMVAPAPKQAPKKGLFSGGGNADGLGGTCTGGAPMLKALGIMQGGRRQQRGGFAGNCTTCKVYRGGKRRGTRRSGTKRNNCRCKPGVYKPTSADKARLNRHLSGKSIGFTQRSSLKAKGLLRRANGTCKVSRKYQ